MHCEKNGQIALTMKKEGTIKVQVMTDCQCVEEGTQTYRYELEICCDADSINPVTGFIVDVEEIDEYFLEKYRTRPARSCERIAIEAVQDLVAPCKRENVVPHRLSFGLHGAAGGFMKADWEPEEELPF